MGLVKFSTGTESLYSQLEVKDINTLYFITDTHRIYKGETLVADSKDDQVKFTTEVPLAESASEGVIYVVTSGPNSGFYIKSGDSVIQVSGGEVKDGSIKSISAFDDSVLSKSTDGTGNDKLPTVGAVSEAIKTQLADYDKAIVKVESARSEDNSGTVLKFTSKDATETSVTIADLFLSSASYDTDTHILTLSVTGQETPVTVDLGELVPQSVNASQVALARSITATVDVGNIKKGQVIDLSSVTDVQKLFEKILSKDSNPTTTQPSASVTLTGAGAKEVGSEFTPSYSVNLNPGSYSANASGAQPTGVEATAYSVTDSSENTSTTATGSFDKFTVVDSTDYYVSATVTYGNGNVPTTFLGEQYPAGQIKAGTKSATSAHVTGYRNGFYGSLTSKTDEINSTLVRGLTKTNKKVAKSQRYTISVPAGTMRVILAYDASIGAVSSITSDEQFGSEIKDSFVLQTVSVNDASGANPKEYNVYVKDLASAQGSTTKYQVTI